MSAGKRQLDQPDLLKPIGHTYLSTNLRLFIPDNVSSESKTRLMELAAAREKRIFLFMGEKCGIPDAKPKHPGYAKLELQATKLDE
jgi:hypothetical protein